MRLETMELNNFGSYRNAAIDLREVAAAVVTGQNGAGKSTGFVDAPLAALFGKCRVSLDDIMALGTEDMVLTLTFALNGQRYRVIRKRSKKTKAGKSELALQIANGDDWEDASGARIQDTQEKICALLNADYDLLTATGFLLQGQADRFSRATPTERKAILAQILRLDQYGPLKQAAGRHGAIAETKVGERQAQVRELTAAAETIPSLEARQIELATALTQSQQAIAQLETHQQELTIKKAALAAELGQLEAIPAQIASLTAARAELVTSQQKKLTRKDRAAKILANRETIDAKVEEEKRLREQLETAVVHEDEVGRAIDQQINAQAAINERINEGHALQRDLAMAVADISRALTDYRKETERLGQAIAQEEATVRLLGQVPCTTELQGRCQFTVQAVSIQQDLPAKRASCEARWAATLEHAAHIAPEHAQLAEMIRVKLKEWESHNYEPEGDKLSACLQTLRDARTKARADKETLQQTLKSVAAFTALVPELAAAERELASVEQDLALHATELARIESELAQLTARQADHARLVIEMQGLTASLQRNTIDLAKLRTDSHLAIGRLKELELELKQAQEASSQAADLQREIDELSTDRRHFQALATAYSQIPVLILESSIPLLEEEANRILGKISTSGLRVTFNTQKALKSRDGLAETLDIAVRDVFGERMLENYSGGERARVDLAIRIGLSKLLANRAGARLETLIVDEAFAAVDREGVEQLVECLPMLSEEFPVILFITHDENFKSSIAQQIIVTKGADGSQVEILA